MTNLIWNLQQAAKAAGRDLICLTIWKSGLARIALNKVASILACLTNEGKVEHFCAAHRNCRVIRIISKEVFKMLDLGTKPLDDADRNVFEIMAEDTLDGIESMQLALSSFLIHNYPYSSTAQSEVDDTKVKAREVFFVLEPIHSAVELMLSSAKSLADLPQVTEQQLSTIPGATERFFGGGYVRWGPLFVEMAGVAEGLLLYKTGGVQGHLSVVGWGFGAGSRGRCWVWLPKRRPSTAWLSMPGFWKGALDCMRTVYGFEAQAA
ncbi:hypothetical protein EJ03DRAFT_340114 [Teratosphaeria nubilosa]|uniref:Uncharacterized protein n=1 Tax=Teratosphaeria nubilosa TaxID=161662 RepID=A0A6G1KTR6_9PEZI|nr:hypothetical protein EJ03DRAFT_340114 [Teratosphaeria nubilosa]